MFSKGTLPLSTAGIASCGWPNVSSIFAARVLIFCSKEPVMPGCSFISILCEANSCDAVLSSCRAPDICGAGEKSCAARSVAASCSPSWAVAGALCWFVDAETSMLCPARASVACLSASSSTEGSTGNFVLHCLQNANRCFLMAS